MLGGIVTPDSATIMVMDTPSDEELEARPHRVIRWVSGEACRGGDEDEVASEERAPKDLLLNAAHRGADGVAHITCKRKGLSLTANCFRRMVCEGDAIGWR